MWTTVGARDEPLFWGEGQYERISLIFLIPNYSSAHIELFK